MALVLPSPNPAAWMLTCLELPKSFAIGNKNDVNDAETVYTVAKQPDKRLAPVTNFEQQDMQTLRLASKRGGVTNSRRKPRFGIF